MFVDVCKTAFAKMANEEKYIIFGGDLRTDFKKSFKSLGKYLYTQLTEKHDQVAIIDGVTGRKITYGEIKAKALHLGEFFRQNGIKVGDVIGICSENVFEFVFTVYGALLYGATVATVNSNYKPDEIRHAFGLTKPKMIFGTRTAFEKIVLKEYPSVEKLIQYGGSTSLKGTLLFESIMQDRRYSNLNKDYKSPPEDLNRNAVIVMSSGTTGLPKGVQITESNILSTFAQYIDDGLPMIGKNEPMMICLPWFHVYGLMTLICIGTWGVLLVTLPRFEERLFLSTIEKYRVTRIAMVPPLMVFLAKNPLVSKYDLSTIRDLYCGAAPLSKEVEDAVMARLPNLEIIRQAYGMSEATLNLISVTGEVSKPGSVGNVATGTYCRVVDPETGKTLGPNQPGELCFKGPQIMGGYIGNEAATKATRDKDGWFHTGDVGYYDEDKFFFIVDRLKELIKYKAFQVPPAELEALLMSHPMIADAAVIGLPDESAGELPLAFVVKQPNKDVTEQEIKDYIASKVSNYKQLRGGVRFINQIPKNPSGKILRRELRLLIKKLQSKL